MLGPLEPLEPEALVVTLELAPAGQMENDAVLACEECLDERSANALALPRRYDCDRGQLPAAIPMGLDLADPDNRAILFGDHEMGPIQAHGVEVCLPYEAADRLLVGFGRRADGHEPHVR